MAKLTIVIPYINDWDGLIMTVMSLKLYHRTCLNDLKVIIVDNALHDSPHSINAEKLESRSGELETKYIRLRIPQGVSVAKNAGIAAVDTPLFACCDSHVMFAPGTIKYMLNNLDEESPNLYQGPMLSDKIYKEDGSFDYKGTEMERVWDNQMLGRWRVNPMVEKGEQYEIDMQGMGFFCGSKRFWPGFHPLNKGFGCEAGYIHDLYRKNGGKCILDPCLIWWHRAGYVDGPKYVNTIDQRVYNYLLAASTVETVTAEQVFDYYVKELNLISETRFEQIFSLVRAGREL